ncbi:MAG: hypothetical protein ABJB78_10195 [Betaproteobacteria bacterium]
MNNETTLRREALLALQLKRLDTIGMSPVEREHAKAQLRRAEAVAEMTARLWTRLGGYARRLRGGGAAVTRAAALR